MVVPAVYGPRHPELAAAALYQGFKAFQAAGRSQPAAALRRELLDRYGQTYHAALLRAELSPKKDP
jgi:hypothetical protein